MLKVLAVYGTRPESIKMAPVIKAMQSRSDAIELVTCNTGQHRDMVQHVETLFDIEPDYRLDVMQPNQSLAGLTGALLTALDKVVSDHQPDWVLAQGDTATVLVAALVAYYHQVKFGHVEAGLRSGDKWRPFPEEGNRRMADPISDAHFAPTTANRAVLLKENTPQQSVIITGNTVIDALQHVAALPYDLSGGMLADVPQEGQLVLITAHRRESFGDTFQQMCHAMAELAQRFPDVAFVYPVHLNPNVQKPVHDILSDYANILLLPPVDYQSMVQLQRRATLVLTDSGGIQEEAPAFGVPVLVMRDTTERAEGIDAGVAMLVGTQRERIVEETSRLLSDPDALAAMQKRANPYGDGQASARIVAYLLGEPFQAFDPNA
ncbi:MAG: UDP-N-acetylglucosamine 2-epimerase (non-hydrolyzing) [Anaerolineaceae bacterium]|nr:UDP-N-acetylglucosamine 2-epimerase (non-hydrolyzing) [Anaerolineaceae bacterium]